MSKILKEISVIQGTYVNKEGQQKNRYQTIGSIIDTKNGDMLKLDVLPLVKGGWDGWAYINDPKPRDIPVAKWQNQGLPADMDNEPF
jgi:hypothetical protein